MKDRPTSEEKWGDSDHNFFVMSQYHSASTRLKRAAVGDGISAGSTSPLPSRDSESPSPRHSKACPTPGPYGSALATQLRWLGTFDENPPRLHIQENPLWTPDPDSHSTQSSFDPPPLPFQGVELPPPRRSRARPVETKGIEVDNEQATLVSADSGAQPKLNSEQWQALIDLHRTLYEHHDFFLASQHPSASPTLRKLAAKYAMPPRMWRHGIHSFLELLRHKLPGSLHHILAIIYLAYSTMALLYEAVPAFTDTWVECLGDPDRYRMAIEDGDIRDRKLWTGFTQRWYSKASHKVGQDTRIESSHTSRPFPEDFALRGLLWTEDYFPTEWFTNEKIDEEEKYHERASMTAQRKERILWLAVRIARITHDHSMNRAHISPFGYLLEHGTMHGFERHPPRGETFNCGKCYLPCHSTPNLAVADSFPTNADVLDFSTSLERPESPLFDSIIPGGLGVLRIIRRILLRTLKLLDSPFTKLALIGLIPAVEALSIQIPPGHVEGCEHRWIVHLRNLMARNFDPEFLAECAALLASSLLLLRYDRDRFMFTSASVLGAVYLGSDERVSNVELAPICVSSAGLIIHYHSKRLAPFDRTSAATSTIIVMLAMVLAEISRRILSPLEGRYEKLWAFHMVANLPAAMIMGWLWEAFVLRLGFAKRFEDAFLERPPRVRDLEGFEVLSELFSAEEINARYQSMLQEKKQQKGLTRASANITSLAW
jgi:hypothetical protein